MGIKILCSVLTFPRTFSQNLLSISAGKGSLAPKSPSKSRLPPDARIFSEVGVVVIKGWKLWRLRIGFLERERKGDKAKCGAEEAMSEEALALVVVLVKDCVILFYCGPV